MGKIRILVIGETASGKTVVAREIYKLLEESGQYAPFLVSGENPDQPYPIWDRQVRVVDIETKEKQDD
jgi:ABC-type dipeptide/oligopeptide/nickel transport system ATPase component